MHVNLATAKKGSNSEIKASYENKSLSLWQIIETEFSLQIELSPYPIRERGSSIDPYYFLKTISYN